MAEDGGGGLRRDPAALVRQVQKFGEHHTNLLLKADRVV